MSRKRTPKSTTSSTPTATTPSPSPSSSSLPLQSPSQPDVSRNEEVATATSTMSKSAASALEATASVVHRVKTQVPESVQSVAQSIPQRLPQNLSRWATSKSSASTQVAQTNANRSTPNPVSRPHKSVSPMSRHLSTPKPTTHLTSLADDVNQTEEEQLAVEGTGSNNATPGTSTPTVEPPAGSPLLDPSGAAEPAEPKTTTSYWLGWWGSGQPPPDSGTDPAKEASGPSEATPASQTELPPVEPPVNPAVKNLKTDNKTLLKARSAENLVMKKGLNASSASINTAPPTLIDRSKTPTQAEPQLEEVATTEATSTQAAQPRPKSWFPMWPYGYSEQPSTLEVTNNAIPDADQPGKDAIQSNGISTSGTATPTQTDGTTILAPPEDTTQDEALVRPADQQGLLARGAAWVFWSKSQPQPDGKQPATETGEIAVAGSSSEADPQKVKVTNETPQTAVTPKKKGSRNSLLSNAAASSSTATLPPSQQDPSVPVAPKEVSPAAKTLQKVLPPNLLVPSFDSCFNPQQSATWLGSVSRLWSAPKAISRNQLYLTPISPRIRKAVSIGVHGFFPMKLVQRVLGEPTGTSVRFATAGAAAIQRWADKHNLSVDIEKIALEGEGRVSDRVEVLWKLLENRLDVIQRADFILVCCHSQGTPVGVHLVARMIEYGLVDRTKIGIIGMAGINLGPFGELNSRILTGSAKELFDFSSPTSLASQQYIESLSQVLAHGVKLVFVGSIDDQLVSLYSSTFSNINHPFIYRAVFVDGRVHAPDFISHVVGLALKLRNIGVRDHGIIRELSGPLAGSLYSGEGHSRIYDDAAIYDLGVRHTLETSTKEFLRIPLKVEDFQLPSASNPYILPWAMRGMLEEKRVVNDLQDEVQTLLAEFAKWQPVTKQLKDVKFRLEAIRSKL